MPLETGVVEIDTRAAGTAVRVLAREGDVLLAVDGGSVQGSRSAALSPEQAEMVLHALGLAVARIREDARLKAVEHAGLEDRLLAQEVRLNAS